MISSHTEMAHVLGLENNLFWSFKKNEGWNLFNATKSIKRRLQVLTGREIHFYCLSFPFVTKISNDIARLRSGSYVGYLTSWSSLEQGRIGSHAYSIHVIRAKLETHFILVNRGQRYENKMAITTVLVFTVEVKDTRTFASKLILACALGRKKVAEFIKTHASNENIAFTNALKKSSQKIGNCTLANSNMAWHLQFTADYLRMNPHLDLAEAYNATKEEYKSLRKRDRFAAFKYLVMDKSNYFLKKAFYHNFFRVIEKIIAKGNEYTEGLVTTLKRDQDFFKAFLAIMNDQDFNQYLLLHVDKWINQNIREAFLAEQAKAHLLELIGDFLVKVRKQLFPHALPTLGFFRETEATKHSEQTIEESLLTYVAK